MPTLESRRSARPVKGRSPRRSRQSTRLPDSLSPQLATLTESPPKGEDWVHEIKYDGYRLLAFCHRNSVALRTRNGKDWTARFPGIAESLRVLALDDCIIDGELVAVDDEGRPDFQALQNAMRRRSSTNLQFMAFDLPFAQGSDLRHAPLLERKRLLRSLLSNGGDGAAIRYTDHIRGHGDAVYENACHLGLEGIISKNVSAPYVNQRSPHWLKVKCKRRQEFIICGFTEPSGSRTGFGALHLAYFDRKELRYAGKVGTGFDDQTLGDLRPALELLAIDRLALANRPSGLRHTTWVRPEYVAEIQYAGRTESGLLRQAVFMGLREDKPPEAVHWEESSPPSPGEHETVDGNSRKAMGTHDRRLTNPDRVLYPEIGMTKQRLADYYENVAEQMLPYVAHRPLVLLRHPKGRQEKGFFQKHIDSSFPSAVKQIEIPDGESPSIYGYVTDVDGLIALVQMGTLEIHPWNCRVDNIEQPDLVVMDLDPAEDLCSEAVVGAALLLRDVLEERAGLKSFLKATGGKGLHVVVPLRRGASWEEVKTFSRSVAEAVEQRNPEAFTTNASKRLRRGRIYLDYLRNTRGATSIAPFSTRAREGAPVAVPLGWEEATTSLKSNAFSIDDIAERLSRQRRDPWAEYEHSRQYLTKATKEEFGMK